MRDFRYQDVISVRPSRLNHREYTLELDVLDRATVSTVADSKDYVDIFNLFPILYIRMPKVRTIRVPLRELIGSHASLKWKVETSQEEVKALERILKGE